jgi:thiol-disulfide isomerase/thioredoxin
MKRFQCLVIVSIIPVMAAGAVLAGDGALGPKERLDEIKARQKATFDRFHADLETVDRIGAAQQPALDRFYAALHKNMDAALDLARANPDDPVAFESLKFVIRTNRAGPGDATARALRMILEHGDVKSPGQGTHLVHIALTLFQYPDAETLLRRVVAENPFRDDRGFGCYWLSKHLLQRARMVRKFRQKPGDMKDYEKYTAAEPIDKFVRETNPDNLENQAEVLFERVIAEFGDLKMNGEPRTLAEIAKGELFSLRNLTVGKMAPKIVGADHEGKPFSLSDFRGKVVLLTFSGDWCGPCKGMYPQERALVTKFKEKPFALVSVNTDTALNTLEKSFRSGEITWRCWWDGGTDGPITTRWGVSSFPSIFVLDHNGVIRFMDVRGDDLDRAVGALMIEIEKQSSGGAGG